MSLQGTFGVWTDFKYFDRRSMVSYGLNFFMIIWEIFLRAFFIIYQNLKNKLNVIIRRDSVNAKFCVIYAFFHPVTHKSISEGLFLTLIFCKFYLKCIVHIESLSYQYPQVRQISTVGQRGDSSGHLVKLLKPDPKL